MEKYSEHDPIGLFILETSILRATRRFLLTLLAISLVGCAASDTKGHKLEELKAPISKLSYVVLPGKVDVSADHAEYFHSAMHDLNILLPQRIPLVFALNGIETDRNSDTQFELIISTKAATFYPPTAIYTNYGVYSAARSWIVETYFSAYITDKSRSSKKIWEGELTFLNSPTAQINAKSVDDFAREILKQLATDGMVKLDPGEIRIPAVDKL